MSPENTHKPKTMHMEGLIWFADPKAYAIGLVCSYEGSDLGTITHFVSPDMGRLPVIRER